MSKNEFTKQQQGTERSAEATRNGAGIYLVNAANRECVYLGKGVPDITRALKRATNELTWDVLQTPLTLDIDLWGVHRLVAAKYKACYSLEEDLWLPTKPATLNISKVDRSPEDATTEEITESIEE
jgi:hypothetical protein